MIYLESQVNLVQSKVYLKGLSLQYSYLSKNSGVFMKSFFLRLYSIRDIFLLFKKNYNFYITTEEKILLALNLKHVKNICFNNSVVVYKKISTSYNLLLLNIYSYGLCNLFNILFLPLVKIKSNRFSYSDLTDIFSIGYFNKFLSSLFFYEKSYKYSFCWQIDSSLTSQTKNWLLRNIPFERVFIEIYFSFINFLEKCDSFSLEDSFIRKFFMFVLINYTLGDLVRLSNVLFFYSLLKI